MGISNITDPENNIHAGIKYIRWLIDNYFPEDEFTYDERMRFALAAYNAGPGNIRRSRDTTLKLGYDPSIWFGHVEFGTLRRVGLEPVYYVRNINKYYLAFLISEVIKDAKKKVLEEVK